MLADVEYVHLGIDAFITRERRAQYETVHGPGRQTYVDKV